MASGTSGTRTITVSIPMDGSIPPCPICGSITVDLDGNPKPCGAHRFCPPCGGTEDGFCGPQFCFVHSCRSWFDDRTHCLRQKDHDGKHGGRGVCHDADGTHFDFEWTP